MKKHIEKPPRWSRKLDNQSYFNNLLEEYQSLQKLSGFVQANRGLFDDSLSLQINQDFQSAIADPENLVSIAFRIEQIAIRLFNNSEILKYRSQSKTAFELAAKIFEQVSESQIIKSPEVNLDLYLHSAIDYSLGEFQANASVIARKVLERFDFDTDSHSIVLKSTFLLLRRSLVELERYLEEPLSSKKLYEGLIQRKIQDNLIDQMGAVEEAGNFMTMEAISSFSKYLRFGQNENFDISTNKISSSLNLFNTIRDPDNYILNQLIKLLFRQMQFCSLWHQLGDLQEFRKDPILDRYIRILTTDKQKPIYELWDSQIAALPKILKSNLSVVLQMPTSAGKTRVAEIKIMQALATSGTRARCIYVAPFKSLVTQVEETIGHYLSKVGYRVTSVFGSYESGDFEDLLIEQSDVLVITPEKLDYLFRQDKEFFNQVRLIVIDEGHLIDNDVRGIRLEFLIQRINRILSGKQSQILFISAVVPNSNEIAEWLEKGTPNLVSSKWKPTRLRQGIFYWDNNDDGTITYPDEKFLLKTKLKRKLLQLYKKSKPQEKLKSPIFNYSNSNDISVELALLFRKASPTIIFTAVRAQINSIAERLYQKIVNKKTEDPTYTFATIGKQAELESLAAIIEKRMGAKFPLAKYVREGIGYHHALLPDDIKILIENAFRNESIRCLIATTTLAQGVNLPVRLMIVSSLRRGGDIPFLIRDFRNIAGRAGRALHETEGLVIFVQNKHQDLLDNRMFSFLQDDKMEKVNSTLFNLYAKLIKHKLGISLEEFIDNAVVPNIEDSDIHLSDDLNDAFQTQILAMLYEGLIDETNAETIKNMIDNSLFGLQWKVDRKFYAPLIEFGQKHVHFLNVQFQSQKQKGTYYRTGFSINSCIDLEVSIRRIAQLDVFRNIRKASDGKLDKEKLTSILQLINIPKETSQKKHSNDGVVIKAMLDWINFGEIAELMDNYASENNLFGNPLEVSDLITKHFMNDAPWALNGISKILTYLQETEELFVHPEINLLSGYVKYGVNTPVAVYLCGLGIRSREIARLISENYYKEVSPQNMIPSQSDFREWLQDITFEDLRIILTNEKLVQEAWSAIKNVKLDVRPIDVLAQPKNKEILTYVVGLKYENRLQHINGLSIGMKLSLVRELENTVDPYALAVYSLSGNKLGYIRSSRAFIFSTLLDQGFTVECVVEKISSPLTIPNRRLLVKLAIQ